MSWLSYPNLANTGGFPLLEGTAAVDATSGNLVVTFQPHAALGEQWTGAFYVKIANTVVTGTQPVVFATQGVTGSTPLYLFSGTQVTAEDIVTTGGAVLFCFYDASSRRLQVLGINA